MSCFGAGTEHTQHHRGFVRPGPIRAILPVCLWLALGVLVAGCSSPSVVTDPVREPGLSFEIDSLVMSPFSAGPRVDINPADLKLFDKHLEQELAGRERFRTFTFAPTQLPNTARVQGLLRRFGVEEQQGEGVYLRTIDLDAELSVLPIKGEEPLLRIRRRLAYQKAYPGPDGVSALPFDVENAIAEWVAQVVEVLDPAPVSEPIVLDQANDPATGESLGHPALIKGNRYASASLFALANQTWHRVLFDPMAELDEIREYRISEQTLNQLRRLGIQEDTLERLRPLSREDEQPLVPFRRMLRERLNGNVEQEGLILTLSDAHSTAVHVNLAAAHANLAALYRLDKRYDLAAYHLARAYAHNPFPERLSQWSDLQERRKLNPGNMKPEELINLWLRLPPPATATMQPGPFALSVAPNPAFGEPAGLGAPTQAIPAPAVEAQQGAAPEAIPAQATMAPSAPQAERTPGTESGSEPESAPESAPAAGATQ